MPTSPPRLSSAGNSAGPLVFPSIIASLARKEESGQLLAIDDLALDALDKLDVRSALNILVEKHGVSSKLAAAVAGIVSETENDYKIALRGASERAKWFAYVTESDHEILRASMSLRLLIQLLGHMVPSETTFARDSETGKEVDLVAAAELNFWCIQKAFWAKFVPSYRDLPRAYGLELISTDCLNSTEGSIGLIGFQDTLRRLIREHGVNATVEHFAEPDRKSVV